MISLISDLISVLFFVVKQVPFQAGRPTSQLAHCHICHVDVHSLSYHISFPVISDQILIKHCKQI